MRKIDAVDKNQTHVADKTSIILIEAVMIKSFELSVLLVLFDVIKYGGAC